MRMAELGRHGQLRAPWRVTGLEQPRHSRPPPGMTGPVSRCWVPAPGESLEAARGRRRTALKARNRRQAPGLWGFGCGGWLGFEGAVTVTGDGQTGLAGRGAVFHGASDRRPVENCFCVSFGPNDSADGFRPPRQSRERISLLDEDHEVSPHGGSGAHDQALGIAPRS
jgi:hypothetical protein